MANIATDPWASDGIMVGRQRAVRAEQRRKTVGKSRLRTSLAQRVGPISIGGNLADTPVHGIIPLAGWAVAVCTAALAAKAAFAMSRVGQ